MQLTNSSLCVTDDVTEELPDVKQELEDLELRTDPPAVQQVVVREADDDQEEGWSRRRLRKRPRVTAEERPGEWMLVIWCPPDWVSETEHWYRNVTVKFGLIAYRSFDIKKGTIQSV